LFSLLRAYLGVYASDISYYRVDEILAGCALALVVQRGWLGGLRRWLAQAPQWPLLLLLLASCMPIGGWLNYLRPYFAALLVGATLLRPRTVLVHALDNRVLIYLAAVSYALYVIHPLLAASWLGDGAGIEKYAKRPLLLIALFALAHLSTNYFERWFIALGRVLAGQDPRARTPLGRYQGEPHDT
jgi:peptidoglycan/LPS O-acetylase OafA/YrhL